MAGQYNPQRYAALTRKYSARVRSVDAQNINIDLRGLYQPVQFYDSLDEDFEGPPEVDRRRHDVRRFADRWWRRWDARRRDRLRRDERRVKYYDELAEQITVEMSRRNAISRQDIVSGQDLHMKGRCCTDRLRLPARARSAQAGTP